MAVVYIYWSPQLGCKWWLFVDRSSLLSAALLSLLDAQVLLRVLDCFFAEGQPFLFGLSIAIFDSIKAVTLLRCSHGCYTVKREEILQQTSPETILRSFKCTSSLDPDAVLAVSFSSLPRLCVCVCVCVRVRACRPNQVSTPFNTWILTSCKRICKAFVIYTFRKFLSNCNAKGGLSSWIG